ncbi:hypothetical protein V8F33_011024 [Rhypophila sp. PSN 637]
MSSSVVKEIEAILVELLGDIPYRQVFSGVSIDPERLPASLREVIKQHGNKMPITVQQKLKLLAGLVCHLKFPLDMCREVIIGSDCLDMPQVVQKFWVDWHAHPQRREFAVALFEAQPTRVILALVSAGFFNLAPTLMADLLETLTRLQTTFQVLREPLKSNDEALLKLDELEDPFRKQAVLSFLTSLQQLSRVLVDPLDLPVLMGLGYLSSEQIAYTPLKSFQLSLAKHGIGQEHSTRIHNQANTVQLQVEQLWMTMLQGNRDLASPRVLFNKPGLLTTVGNAETLSRGLSPADNNLSAWFGDLDEVGCEDCCSVTSPAAYFVDLLRFLKNQPALPNPSSTDQKDIPAPVSAENSLLRKLLMRRPDLGDLLLSCRNTSELVPYIDLVNEALESAVVYLHGREDIGMGLQLRAYNADDSTFHAHDKATNSPASQDAANICFHVYDELISKKVHPAKIFPYDLSKDSLRQYLLTAGTDAVEVLRTFRSDFRLESIDPKFGSLAKDDMAVDMVHSRILAAETLGMAQADFVAITRESYYDIFTARLVEGDNKLSRTDYEKIAGLLPAWEYWGYEDKKIGEGDEEDTIFGEDVILDTKEGKGLPFIKTQLLPRLDQDFSTLFEILKTSFLGGCLTISPLPSGQAFDPLKNMPAQLEGFRLRGARGDPLDISSLQRLDQFNRLWRRLGWSIEDVDNALCILGDHIESVDSADIPVIKITANTVEQLAAVSELCKVFNTSPRRVLALFSPSARLLTDLPISKAILASGKQPLGKTGGVEGEISASQYLPFILSSLDMSYDDYVHVQTVEKIGDHLTMHVLFRYYRMAETARLMKIAVAEVTDLLEILARSTAETALTKPKAYLEMMLDWKRFQSSGLSSADLISVSKPQISQPPSISTLDCAAKMLSSALGTKQVLASTRVPPGAGSESSIAQPHGNSSLHNVVQTTFRAICPDIPAATLRTLLHFPHLPGFESGTTLYDYGIQISRETAVNPCSPEFQGGLFLTSDSAIHIEASWTSADVSPPILAYGGHEFKFSATGAALKTGVRVECDMEGKKDNLIPLSWPKGLSDITMSFSYPDGDNISAPASPPHVVSEESLINFQYVTDVLRRYALLLQRYPMQPEELEVVLPCALSSSQDKGMTARFFNSVRSYTEARKALSRPGQSKEFAKTLLWLREASLADEADSLVLVAKRLAQGTIMQQSTAEKILEGNFPKTGASVIQDKLQDFQILELIGKQVQLLKRTGLKEDSIELLFLLAQPPPFRCTTTQAKDRPEKQLAQLTRAALVNKGLRDKLESAQDKLRDNRRRALVQFLLQHPALKAQGVFDENSMFEYFLIDVQMGCGLDTTRIKQAISTVQLFIHRCLVGLEKNRGVDGTLIPQDRWAWMQKYTLWEANRKVFLYPENWVDPTLRDSKTQLFKSIEDAMTQTNLDDKAICKAIRSYVYGADDTANLRIEGCYWDRAPIKLDKSAGEQVTGEGSFHFFARTRNSPYHFYYRRLDYISRAALPATSFTAWEKLPFDVRSHDIDHDGKSLAHPGAYIVPVVWRNRLVIFLPHLTVKTSKNTSENAHTSLSVTSQSNSGNAVQEMKVGSASANHVQLNMEIKMCWSEYIDGAWSPQKQSQDSLHVSGSTPDRPPEFDAFRFTVRFGDGGQSVSVRVYQNTSPSGDLIKNTCLGEYSLQGPKLSFRTAQSGSTLVQLTKLPKSLSSNLGVAAWPSLSKPPLDQSRKCTSVAWTMDSNETSNRQLGLVADICTRDGLGYEPWFTIPTKLAKSIGTVEDDGDVMLSVPFFNSLNDALRQSVTADDGVESIYHVMDKASLESDSGTKNNYAFGRFGFLSQCREDASPPAIYNWELGFHLVSLIVERLMSLQEFDRAIKYAQLVFDPTGTNEPPKEKSQAWRPTWRFPPFRDPATLTCGTLDSIIDGLDPSSGSEITMTHSIRTWRQKPFQPHAVARGRPLAYMKRIVIKYVEALIASGDAYFRQNSLESVPLAIQRYVEAAHIFGPTAPQSLPALGTKRFKSYNDIEKQIDDFSNASVELQLSFPYFIPLKERGLSKTDPSALQSFPRSRYFGVQANQSFLDLRKLVDDRLFKIRNSLDINGNPRTLSLWDPPLDVGNLVNAAAVGTPTDMALIASGFSPILPRARFTYLMQKAFELCGELKQISSSLLSAIEKKDAEALQLMRANQETGMQRILKEMKLMQKLEAEKGLEQLDESRKAAMYRLEFYAALTGDKVDVPDIGQDFQLVEQNIPKPTDEDLRLTRHEILELRLADNSSMYNLLASSQDDWAAILLAVPMPSLNAQPMGVGISEQLPNLAQAFQAEAASLRADALRASENAQRAARISQWTRQLQERRLQLNMAGLDIQNINKQIEIHRVRIAAIEKDILAQDQTAQNAADVQKFLSTKFTNEELYNWLENSARSYLYQVYLVAMEMARKVETAYNFEQGGQRRPILASTGYWDQGKRGLECGNQLWFALKQMELAYLGEKRHDFELTKNVSLRQLSPAGLISLRELGDATFEIPELLFDMDFPGHYFRRIKSVSISIHCITGPYTSINCTATLIDHCYRWNPVAAGGDYAEKTGGRGDSRFMGNQVQTPITSIAMSSGQQDAGVFELNFNGEAYQPFEGAGAISKWRLRLPNKFRQFDYRSISDVVLQVRYTAKDGGQGLCEAAALHVEEQLKNISKSTSTGLLLDVRNDCPDAWFALTRAGSQQVSAMPMNNMRDRLPYFTRGQNIKVKTVTAYVRSPTDIMSSLELYVAKSQDAQAAAAPGGAVKLAYAEKLGEHNLHVFRQVVTASGGGGDLQTMLQADSPWYLILSGDKTLTVVQDIMLLVDYILE